MVLSVVTVPEAVLKARGRVRISLEAAFFPKEAWREGLRPAQEPRRKAKAPPVPTSLSRTLAH